MLHDIKELENELASFITSNGKTSKIKTIEALLPLIEQAIKDSITIDMLVDFFHQKGLNITKNYLKTAIQRIRKKNKNTNAIRQEPLINKPVIKNKQNENQKPSSINKSNDELLDEILDRFSATKDLKERYKVLGGNPDDFMNKSISDRRQLVSHLKMKIMRQYQN